MCTPLAAVGLMAAGTAAQAVGANRARKAMSGAREAERIRQKGYQDEAGAVFDASKANASRSSQDAQQGKLEADRKAAYDNDVASAQAPNLAIGDNLAGSQAGNAIVNDEVARQGAKASAFAGQQGDAKAALQGFGDLQFANSLANNRTNTQLGTLGNFMRGSADVLPYEMEAASHKGAGLNALGSVLNMAGTVAGVGSGAGWWDKAPVVAPHPSYTGGFGMPLWLGGNAPKNPWDFSALLKKNPAGG